MTPTILLIGGKKGSGKDTAADVLTDHWGFRKIAFAGPIKRGIGQGVFKLNDEQLHGDKKEKTDPVWGLTPRQILQKAGTDAFKPVFGKDIWAKSAVAQIRQSDHERWVIPDTRFPVEISVIKRAFKNVATMYINAEDRLDITLSWWKTKLCQIIPSLTDRFGAEYHPSETALDGYAGWDFCIDNNESRSDLEVRISRVARYIIANDFDPHARRIDHT